MAVEQTDQRVLVALATYNERENLADLVAAILAAADTEVLVLDDNSPDGTGRVADELAAADPRVRVIHRPGKQGLGTAILAALGYAMDHGYDLVVTMDADFSHHPRYLPDLLAGMTRKDVMIGSRYVPGGGTVNWPISRRMISRSVNLLVRFLMGIPARDCSGGFRCYRVARLRETDLDNVVSRGYSFEQEVLHRCYRSGSRIGETPIVFENRRNGVSKVNAREALKSLSILLWLGCRAFADGRPRQPKSAPGRGRGSAERLCRR